MRCNEEDRKTESERQGSGNREEKAMKDTTDSLERLPASAGYALNDTRIEMAGVMRCCLATVAEEYQGKDGPEGDQRVTLGMKSQCRHCKQPFTLVAAQLHPKWIPDWQLDGHNDQAEARRDQDL